MKATATWSMECTNLIQRVMNRLGDSPGGIAGFESALGELCSYVTGAAGGSSAVEVENEAITAGLRIVRPLLEVRLQEALDKADLGLAGEAACRRCAGTLQSQGRRSRSWASLSGRLTLTRRYSHCAKCEEGRAPGQDALGLTESSFTPRLEEVVTLAATTVAHAMAKDLIERMLGVDVSVKAVEQMVERRAQEVSTQLTADALACAPYDETGLPVATQARPADAVKAAPKRVYLEMDGVVPMTRELLGPNELSPADRRRQKAALRDGARGGRGRRYRLVGREVKNAVLYRAEDCREESAGRSAIGAKKYVSHLGDWRQFAALLWVEMLRQGFDRAEEIVVISDGAAWIRELCTWLPVKVTLILDLFHVKHRIWEVANLLHGEHSADARAWAETQGERIEAGRADAVRQALRFAKPRGYNAREAVRLLIEYLASNEDRMKYPEYRRRGLRVGSGAVESANYHVTGARLKLQGMRWSEQGARDMAYLRADLFNGNWEARTRALRTA